MKFFQKIGLLTLGIAALFTSSANAAVSSKTATVKFVSPISITENTQMNFGIVETGGTVGQTLILQTDGTLNTGTAAAKYLSGASQGIFTVDASGSTLTIWVDNFVADTVTLSAPKCDYDAGGANTTCTSGTPLTGLTAGTGGGAKALHIGGTLTLAGTETAGSTYTPGFDINVNYE